MYLYMWYACVHVTMYLYVFICMYIFINKFNICIMHEYVYSVCIVYVWEYSSIL